MNSMRRERASASLSMAENRLKIGYLMQANAVNMSTVSGPQLHVRAVVEGFEKRGHAVRMVAIQQGKTQWTDDRLTWYPCEFGFSQSIPFRLVESPSRFLQGRLRLPFFRFFDSYRFSDACVSALSGYQILYERDSTISYGGIITARRLGVPIVLEVNGDLITEWEHLGLRFSKTQQALVHFITRQMYQHASHIVAVGETIRERLIRRWRLAPNRVSVVTNGADIDLFLNSVNSEDIRARYSIRQGSLIIFTGGFQPWHGVDLILEAFALIAPIQSEATLVLVGDGPMRPKIQQQAISLGLGQKVVFTGKVDHADVAHLLCEADISVIYHRASAAEIVETPLKLFEYMAAGKAIVAPAVPNMQRILTNGVCGMLVPPDDPQALAKAFNGLLENYQLRQSLGQSARKEAIEKHSWDRAVAELESILYGLLHKA